MISPYVRLTDSRDIVATLRSRRQRSGHLVGVHVRMRESDGDAVRIAVVASRRVGDAVQRNRAKRLLREAAQRVPFLAGHDIVLIARAACAESTLDAVRSELQGLVDVLWVEQAV